MPKKAIEFFQELDKSLNIELTSLKLHFEKMAGGPLLQLWESVLPYVKDLKVRFALAMIGNALALWFVITIFKRFIPDLPAELMQ